MATGPEVVIVGPNDDVVGPGVEKAEDSKELTIEPVIEAVSDAEASDSVEDMLRSA
jgi:hypothetical protein